jgi:hypothetical protein
MLAHLKAEDAEKVIKTSPATLRSALNRIVKLTHNEDRKHSRRIKRPHLPLMKGSEMGASKF